METELERASRTADPRLDALLSDAAAAADWCPLRAGLGVAAASGCRPPPPLCEARRGESLLPGVFPIHCPMLFFLRNIVVGDVMNEGR